MHSLLLQSVWAGGILCPSGLPSTFPCELLTGENKVTSARGSSITPSPLLACLQRGWAPQHHFSWSIHLLMDVWVSTFWLSCIILLEHLYTCLLCRHVFISPGYVARGKFLGQMVLCSCLLRNYQTVSQCGCITLGTVAHLPCSVWKFQSLHFLINTGYHQSPLSAILAGVEWFSPASSWLLMIRSIFLVTCIYSSQKYLFRFFAHFYFISIIIDL